MVSNKKIIIQGEEESVHKATYEVPKASEMDRTAYESKKAALRLIERETETVILKCTEIETVFRKISFPFPVVKPTEIKTEKILEDFTDANKQPQGK